MPSSGVRRSWLFLRAQPVHVAMPLQELCRCARFAEVFNGQPLLAQRLLLRRTLALNYVAIMLRRRPCGVETARLAHGVAVADIAAKSATWSGAIGSEIKTHQCQLRRWTEPVPFDRICDAVTPTPPCLPRRSCALPLSHRAPRTAFVSLLPPNSCACCLNLGKLEEARLVVVPGLPNVFTFRTVPHLCNLRRPVLPHALVPPT